MTRRRTGVDHRNAINLSKSPCSSGKGSFFIPSTPSNPKPFAALMDGWRDVEVKFPPEDLRSGPANRAAATGALLLQHGADVSTSLTSHVVKAEACSVSITAGSNEDDGRSSSSTEGGSSDTLRKLVFIIHLEPSRGTAFRTFMEDKAEAVRRVFGPDPTHQFGPHCSLTGFFTVATPHDYDTSNLAVDHSARVSGTAAGFPLLEALASTTARTTSTSDDDEHDDDISRQLPIKSVEYCHHCIEQPSCAPQAPNFAAPLCKDSATNIGKDRGSNVASAGDKFENEGKKIQCDCFCRNCVYLRLWRSVVQSLGLSEDTLQNDDDTCHQHGAATAKVTSNLTCVETNASPPAAVHLKGSGGAVRSPVQCRQKLSDVSSKLFECKSPLFQLTIFSDDRQDCGGNANADDGEKKCQRTSNGAPPVYCCCCSIIRSGSGHVVLPLECYSLRERVKAMAAAIKCEFGEGVVERFYRADNPVPVAFDSRQRTATNCICNARPTALAASAVIANDSSEDVAPGVVTSFQEALLYDGDHMNDDYCDAAIEGVASAAAAATDVAVCCSSISSSNCGDDDETDVTIGVGSSSDDRFCCRHQDDTAAFNRGNDGCSALSMSQIGDSPASPSSLSQIFDAPPSPSSMSQISEVSTASSWGNGSGGTAFENCCAEGIGGETSSPQFSVRKSVRRLQGGLWSLPSEELLSFCGVAPGDCKAPPLRRAAVPAGCYRPGDTMPERCLNAENDVTTSAAPAAALGKQRERQNEDPVCVKGMRHVSLASERNNVHVQRQIAAFYETEMLRHVNVNEVSPRSGYSESGAPTTWDIVVYELGRHWDEAAVPELQAHGRTVERRSSRGGRKVVDVAPASGGSAANAACANTTNCAAGNANAATHNSGYGGAASTYDRLPLIEVFRISKVCSTLVADCRTCSSSGVSAGSVAGAADVTDLCHGLPAYTSDALRSCHE